MRESRAGLIVNMSSVSGRFSGPFFALYHASKWALEGYSLALRAELASSGVDVVVVEPGPFRTELLSTSRKPLDKECRARSYPPVVHHSFNRFIHGFNSILDDPNSPIDPMLVVERVVSLLAMRAGTRPFRTVVGVDFGVINRNSAVAPFDEALLQDFGLTSFATIVPE
jgi:NAD(P)-dependent dehydrogenase (short-subunit alcohol dehydrogenase family)